MDEDTSGDEFHDLIELLSGMIARGEICAVTATHWAGSFQKSAWECRLTDAGGHVIPLNRETVSSWRVIAKGEDHK